MLSKLFQVVVDLRAILIKNITCVMVTEMEMLQARLMVKGLEKHSAKDIIECIMHVLKVRLSAKEVVPLPSGKDIVELVALAKVQAGRLDAHYLDV